MVLMGVSVLMLMDTANFAQRLDEFQWPLFTPLSL